MDESLKEMQLAIENFVDHYKKLALKMSNTKLTMMIVRYSIITAVLEDEKSRREI